MTQYQWQTLADGTTVVNGEAIVLTDPIEIAALQKNVIDRWGPLLAKQSRRTGVPLGWLTGIVYSETYPVGNPNSLSSVGAAGLMQVMPDNFPKYYGRAVSREEMFDPEINTTAGSNFVADMIAHGLTDLPSIASGFNAGLGFDPKSGKYVPHTCGSGTKCRDHHSNTAWGPTPETSLFAEKNYIEQVVRAANYATLHKPTSTNAFVAKIGGDFATRVFALGGAALLGVGGYLYLRDKRATK